MEGWKVFISPNMVDVGSGIIWKNQRLHVIEPLLVGALASGRFRIANATEGYVSTASAALTTIGIIRAYSFYVPADLNLKEIMINQVNGAGLLSYFRFGLYSANQNGLPGSLIIASNQLEGINGGASYSLQPANLILSRGIYFFAITALLPMTFRGIPQANMVITHGFTSGTQTTPISRFEAPFLFGELPAVFPSPLTQANGAGHNPIAVFTKFSLP